MSALPEGLLIFQSFNTEHLSDLPAGSDADKEDATLSINVFYSFDRGDFRFLGEYFKDKEESELERLQLGWDLSESSTLWIGRYHNPIGYWNVQFHHGQYLQTSISRPGIIPFEDEGGVQPVHITGLLLEGSRDRQDGVFVYAVSLGAGTQLTDDGLEPLDLFNPDALSHGISFTTQLSWQPDASSESLTGLSFGYTVMPSDVTGISEVKQTHASVFTNQEFGDWRVIAALTYLHNRVDRKGAQNRSSSFTNVYTQLEYNWNDKWTAFSRIEESFSENRDFYLSLFPDFTISRRTAGVRYEFSSSQAITLETGKDTTQSDSFNTLSLQWSMLFR